MFDVTAPEVRSTAQAVEYFIENSGAALAPALAGAVAVAIGLGRSILIICTSAWLLCFVIYIGALFTIDHDVHILRSQMAARAKALSGSGSQEPV